jgi:hypothetical protein
MARRLVIAVLHRGRRKRKFLVARFCILVLFCRSSMDGHISARHPSSNQKFVRRSDIYPIAKRVGAIIDR